MPALPVGAGLRENGEGGAADFVQGQLAARGHYVAAARMADKGGNAALDQEFLEEVDVFDRGLVIRKLAWIPGDEVHFRGFQWREEFHDAARIG